MKRIIATMAICGALFSLISCENESNNQTVDIDIVLDDVATETEEPVDETIIPDTAADDVETPDTDTGDDPFDPEDPGYNIFFQIMTMEVFGNPTAMAFGVIMKTAREDRVSKDTPNLPKDTCVFSDSGSITEPECASKEDCAPEQECVPRTDNSGNPIAGTEHCATPDREPLDRGPVTIAGFVGGSRTFAFEPNDKVYKLDGTGDGSIDSALLTFHTEYQLTGAGQDDLSSFSSKVYFPPSLRLTFPEATTGGSLPFPSIDINPAADVLVKWDQANPGAEMDLTLTGESGSVVCRVADDGEFAIPVALVSQIQFGAGFAAMANNLILSRKFSEYVTGDSVTSGTFNSEEMVMMVVNAVTGY